MPISGSTITLDPRQISFSLGARENILPYISDSYDLGSADKLWRTAYLSELYSLLFVQNSIVLLGSRFIVGKGQGSLSGSVAAASTQIDFNIPMTPNDFILFRVPLQIEAMQIGTLASGSTVYNVSRNLDGSGANSWPAGSVYHILGNNGDGRIELDAENSPKMKVFLQGTAWNSGSDIVRIGDLNGGWGYSTTRYGAAFGEYAINKPNITIDTGSGLRIRNYNTDIIRLDTSGCSLITGKLLMPEINSAISVGVVPPTGSSLGTGIWIDRTGLFGLKGNENQISIDSASGILNAGATQLSASGLRFLTGTENPTSLNGTIKFTYNSGSTATFAQISAVEDGGGDALQLYAVDRLKGAITVGKIDLDVNSDTQNGSFELIASKGLGYSAGYFDTTKVMYSGSLVSYKNSTEYPGYIHVPLATQLTNSYFNGTSFADVTTSSPINMYQRFGVPMGTKAVDLQILTIESGSFGSQGLYFSVGPSASEWYHLASRPLGGYVENEARGWTSCSLVAGSPVIFCQINASSGSSLKAYMRVCGYAI